MGGVFIKKSGAEANNIRMQLPKKGNPDELKAETQSVATHMDHVRMKLNQKIEAVPEI